MKPRYHQSLCLLFLLSVFLGCQHEPSIAELTGAIQGTTYHIKLGLQTTPAALAQLQKQIDETFADIDLKLSNYRDDSEISRFNRQQTLDWVPVSPEIVQLCQLARQVSEKTHGCFDLTIKPLFDLWGFSRNENRIPTTQEIRQVLAHVGMKRIETDLNGNRLRKRDKAVQVDLSSVGQGYTVKVISDLLEHSGIQNYLVEVGGEMKVKGHKPDGTPWRVAIEKPTPYSREIQRVLDIHQEAGTAIMTAGTYRHFFEDNGQVYSHILDPRTGRPVTHQLLSVTILHNDPTMADVWDTALLCVGETEAAHIAEAEHLKVLLISKDHQQLREHMSPEFMTAQEAAPNSSTANPASLPTDTGNR